MSLESHRSNQGHDTNHDPLKYDSAVDRLPRYPPTGDKYDWSGDRQHNTQKCTRCSLTGDMTANKKAPEGRTEVAKLDEDGLRRTGNRRSSGRVLVSHEPLQRAFVSFSKSQSRAD